jgi:glyoxylase-like metal-dependent hydrolase (beta-lactamase superfamily II)
MHDHSIWTFCYARGRIPNDMMGGCPVCSNQGMTDIPMAYSLITSAPDAPSAHRVLVDCGFKGGQSMTGSRFQSIEMPEAVLAKVGLTPADITVLVLTHLHFDHAGNFDAFPNARIVVQRREYERWRAVIDALPDRTAGKGVWELSSMDVDVLDAFSQAVTGGRIELIDGDAEVAPGVTCHLAADSHTFGSQWVEVSTHSGPHVIAGDCVYWYANMERLWPPGYAQGNAWNLMATYRQLRELVGEDHLERVIPGHDMEIFKRHRNWLSGLNPVAEVHLAAGEPSRLVD